MTGEGRTQSVSLQHRPPPLRGGVVRVVQGPDEGLEVTFGPRPVLLGSSVENDLRLTDRKISRRHCEVCLASHGFRVRDLGSRNGTYFEGARVGEIAVPRGALLRLGDTLLALSPEERGLSLPPFADDHFGGLWGRSPAMRHLFTLLDRAASGDATVLLGGETGTGKELAARAIHQASQRASAPFEVLDCGAVSTGLLASALFGHERGAFTGAVTAVAGVFERANGGTVFMDEVGELSLEQQSALLRVCDRGEVMRLGARQHLRIDVRLIAATHRVLAREVALGRFREDLYYRLAVLPIVLPPLRLRPDDLPLLCEQLLHQLGVTTPGPIAGPNLQFLLARRWPGNVRELRNTLERAIALCGPVPFGALLLQEPSGTGVGATPAPDGFRARRKLELANAEKKLLNELLQTCGGNVRAACKVSGMERSQLRRLLKRHGLLKQIVEDD